jgi:RNA polymerase sigma-70 factor, ECF subfamily
MISNHRKLRDVAIAPGGATSAAQALARDTLDDALIERIVEGDEVAMKVLYTRHNVRVYRFALRLVGNDAIAEEVTNEVFLDVWRLATTFERRSQVTTWLLAVTRHKALQALRRRPTEPWDNEMCGLIPDASDDPEVAIDKSQTHAILFECLSKLTPAHREVVDLIYYHHKTIDEVADIVGLERSTVKTRMFYARKRLAEMLGAQGIATA